MRSQKQRDSQNNLITFGSVLKNSQGKEEIIKEIIKYLEVENIETQYKKICGNQLEQ